MREHHRTVKKQLQQAFNKNGNFVQSQPVTGAVGVQQVPVDSSMMDHTVCKYNFPYKCLIN